MSRQYLFLQQLSIFWISKLLMTRFWPNFKCRLLGPSWADFRRWKKFCRKKDFATERYCRKKILLKKNLPKKCAKKNLRQNRIFLPKKNVCQKNMFAKEIFCRKKTFLPKKNIFSPKKFSPKKKNFAKKNLTQKINFRKKKKFRWKKKF